MFGGIEIMFGGIEIIFGGIEIIFGGIEIIARAHFGISWAVPLHLSLGCAHHSLTCFDICPLEPALLFSKWQLA